MEKFTNLSKAFLPMIKGRKGMLVDGPANVFEGVSLGHSPTAVKQGTASELSAEETKKKQQLSINARPEYYDQK